jgi:hypothetical protein
MYAHIDVKYNNVNLHIEDHGGYESRHKSMVNLMRDAWQSRIRNDLPPEPLRFFTLYTDDCFNPQAHFSFAAGDPVTARRCVPHFIFDQWPECGMPNYEKVFEEVALAGRSSPEFNKAFWIGVVFSEDKYPHCHRSKGRRVASRLPELIDFREIEWRIKGPEQFKHTPGYVTIPYHCKYQVLLDFGGIGFSARLPLLLASGRPVIVVGRPQEAWFYWDAGFSPWMNYVPCGSKEGIVTEGDIKDAVRWAFDNPAKAAEIGQRGREYAFANLTRSRAVDRMGDIMEGFCRDMWPPN